MPAAIDFTGQQFGYWTVLCRSRRRFYGGLGWHCRCVCGVERAKPSKVLKAGKSKSCGCRQYERWENQGHGEANKTPEYTVWANMLNRCDNPKHPKFPRYGARGIKVCAQWYSYTAFLADMGRRPSLAHSIERKNNDLGYDLDNCVWATRQEQQRNRGNTVHIVTRFVNGLRSQVFHCGCFTHGAVRVIQRLTSYV